MDDDTYHSHPATSASQIEAIATSTLRHYWAEWVDPDRPARVQTDAMRFGTELHMLLLEPDRFAERYHLDLTPPDAPRRPTAKQLESLDKEPPKVGTKARDERDRIAAAAAWWRDWDRDHPIPAGSMPLPADRWLDLQGMTGSLLRDPLIGELLAQPGQAEQALFWTDPDLGIDCRCKPDWLTDDGWVLDLKSARTADPRRFQWQAWDLGYDIQAWFYLRGIEQSLGIRPKGFIFAACEKSRPWVCVPYLATEWLLDYGRARTELAVARLLEARDTGIWPGYAEPGKLVDLNPPKQHEATL
jgi:PDDEXK-like domain of unknown function (DUF3799)